MLNNFIFLVDIKNDKFSPRKNKNEKNTAFELKNLIFHFHVDIIVFVSKTNWEALVKMTNLWVSEVEGGGTIKVFVWGENI